MLEFSLPKFLNAKIGQEPTFEIEYKSFIYGLQEMGFDEEQINELSKSYLKIYKLSKKLYSVSKNDSKKRELILEEWHDVNKIMEEDLLFYINRNNERVQNGYKL